MSHYRRPFALCWFAESSTQPRVCWRTRDLLPSAGLIMYPRGRDCGTAFDVVRIGCPPA